MRHQNCRLRLTVRTSPFQGGNTGSIPVADTKTWGSDGMADIGDLKSLAHRA